MARDGEGRYPAGVKINGDRAECLHSVRVHGNTVFSSNGGDFGDGLYGTDLVVRPHDGHERNVLGILFDELANGLRVDTAVLVHGNPFELRALCLFRAIRRFPPRRGAQWRRRESGALRVFFAALPVDALDCEVVRLGAAGGENNLGGVRSNSAGDAFAGVLDGGAGITSGSVQGGGLPPLRICSTMASMAAGSTSVVAAWSR